MANVFIKLLLPMGLCGSLFYGFACLLRIACKQLKATWHKALLLLTAAFFALPIGLLAIPFTQADTRSQYHLPLPLPFVLGNLPVAPAYSTGKALTNMLETAENTDAAQNIETDNTSSTVPSPQQVLRLAIYAYYLGAGGVLLSKCTAHVRFARRLRKASIKHVDNIQNRVYTNVCNRLVVKHRPSLYCSHLVPAPLLVGVLHPIILLPAGLSNEKKLELALHHELCHLKYKDNLCKQLIQLVCVLHWYNPLVHLLQKQFSAACERACDESVTTGMSLAGRHTYATTLLSFANPFSQQSASEIASPKKHLKERIERFMNPKKPSRLMRTFGIVLPAWLLCMVTLVGCGLTAGTYNSTTTSAAPSQNSLSEPLPASETSAPSLSASLSGDSSASVSHVETGEMICPVPDVEYLGRGWGEGGHRGLDFNAPEGTAIYAAAGGTVLKAEEHYAYGKYVAISHPNGYITLYAHCSNLFVEEGQEIQQGDRIASVGSTGNSSGSHCHFEVIQDGEDAEQDSTPTLLDPLEFVTIPDGISFK